MAKVFGHDHPIFYQTLYPVLQTVYQIFDPVHQTFYQTFYLVHQTFYQLHFQFVLNREAS
ncbi:hypothetical protein CO009_03060 [Candidatus Shapirobacteria bacterium CG_4_8_14_3_um_filter_35_11]|uniref:Uncharacterized protein n=4 Tax=Candidatus Shapironibacteriota TaxID=1752721 RepID=A0A2M7XNZ8_9BACT|nr:MAG: hypothetical protein COS53_00860 [Candidatus Shapirobacteria bacterium CG03_land_8_20_14_0_80_35_14]PIX68103.1 MAG: hypothetical protein COZ41_01490 [Candidatus Shapirobacteria bacterium CG_4_10_14_3_um_filter_35_13]PJA51270.1 MAG: hypothetical protein CO168_00685 [Candidatus Shapirobacteria bacterium CG_4_9_14_3_um_filter_36_12]PJC79946.1 MAG: hypothetical protein CO009_03060 [Candidatus Shapirobacteria bacterium CG_4_8_14_3_um_filter_35_11]